MANEDNLCVNDTSSPFIVFVHGLWGCGTNVWFPYAHVAVSDCDCNFISPDCPNPFDPDYLEWKNTILDSIAWKWNKKQKIILVGHSYGAYTLFRILSECYQERWVKYVHSFLTVAPALLLCEMSQFSVNPNFSPIDFQQVFALPIKFRNIYCVNDSVVPPRNSEYLTKIMEEHKADYHVNAVVDFPINSHFGGDKHYPVPIINEELVKLIDDAKSGL